MGKKGVYTKLIPLPILRSYLAFDWRFNMAIKLSFGINFFLYV